jgi:hypothetical protein
MLCNDKLLLSISFVLDTTLAINTDERLNNATTGNTHGEETNVLISIDCKFRLYVLEKHVLDMESYSFIF